MAIANSSVAKVNQFRQNFPALKNKSYFNYGALGVLSNQVLDEIEATYRYVQEVGPFGPSMLKWLFDQIHETRQAFATTFGGKEENYALTTSVTDGCNIVFWGIDWKPGDHLITTNCEHVGVFGSLAQLAKRHRLEVTHVDAGNAISDDQLLSSIEKALKPNTRLVVLSHVLWNTGRVLPVDEIGKLCRTRSVRFLVDGAQSAGVLPLQLNKIECDYYAITAHKWMCAPEGMACLYVREGMSEELEPAFVGWRGVSMDANGNVTGWEKGAARFEVATAPFPLMAPLRTALKMHDDFAEVAERFELLSSQVLRFKQALMGLSNVQLISDINYKSSLVTFKVGAGDQRTVSKELEQRKILIRTIPQPDALRASIHYFTNEAELDALIDSIRAMP